VAAAGLYVYGDVADFKEGVDKAYAVLSSGKAITKVRFVFFKDGNRQAADWH
jgi:anthranilate phosphoribosyltransferase